MEDNIEKNDQIEENYINNEDDKIKNQENMIEENYIENDNDQIKNQENMIEENYIENPDVKINIEENNIENIDNKNLDVHTEDKIASKNKDDKNIIIQTHGGKFHADDCASVSLLTNYYSRKGYNVSLLRSRDQNKISDILVDVGLIYDPVNKKFDHHQSDFNEKWVYNSNEISDVPLSSIGLIWRHYGKEIVKMYLTANSDTYDFDFNYTDETINKLVDLIYKKLIYEIDADDNGIVLKYNSENLNIQSIIASMNSSKISDDVKQDENFSSAVGLIGLIFDIKFKEIINSYFNYSRDLQIVDGYDLTGNYLTFTENIPTIFKCLDELDKKCCVKFCIFGDEAKNEYSIKCRRLRGEKYTPICSIANEEYLRKNIKVKEDIIFIHKAGFIAKTKTLQSAREVIELSINYHKILERERENEMKEKENEMKENDMKKLAHVMPTVLQKHPVTIDVNGYWNAMTNIEEKEMKEKERKKLEERDEKKSSNLLINSLLLIGGLSLAYIMYKNTTDI